MRRMLYATMLLLFLIAGCSSRRGPAPAPVAHPAPEWEPQPAVTVQTEPVPIAQQMAGQSGVVRVVVTDKGFEPDVIATTVGGRVKIHLINQGTKEHTLSIPRWAIFTRNLAPGEENYIEFTASEKGIWPFFSDTPGEPEPGLAGEVKVE